MPQRPSLLLAPSQQNQSFQSKESLSEQQRSSQSTMLPLQHHQDLRQHQQQLRLQLREELSQQEQNSQSAVHRRSSAGA